MSRIRGQMLLEKVTDQVTRWTIIVLVMIGCMGCSTTTKLGDGLWRVKQTINVAFMVQGGQYAVLEPDSDIAKVLVRDPRWILPDGMTLIDSSFKIRKGTASWTERISSLDLKDRS